MDYILVVLMGLIIGSFLNVVIDRLPKNQTILKGRSYCDKCKKTLGWKDLIPLISFLFLKGKCRYCHFPISSYYPLVELITGALFLLTSLFVSNNYQLIYYLIIVSSFIVIFFTDLKYGIIPDKVILFGVIASFVYLIFNPQLSVINYLFSAFGALVFFLLLFLITKGKGIGFGDVKLSFLLGLVLGFPNIVLGLYLAFLTGAFVAVILVICGKKRLFKDTIPLGPFLILGTFISLFWGNLLVPKILKILNLS